MVSTGTPMALLIISSPFAHGRINALARVVELKPAARDSAASEVPFLCSAAMISALCQSG